MEFEIAFSDDGRPADVEITATGVPTPAEFAKLNEQLLSDNRFRTGVTMLVDCTALDTTGLSDEDVQDLTEPMVMRDWHYPPLAVAIIAPGDLIFETAVSYRAHLGGSRSHRQVFRTRDDAVAWLAEQR